MPSYDPINFMKGVKIFTIATLAGFATWKLSNTLYDHLYEPAINVAMDSDHTDKYYIKIGNEYKPIGMIVRDVFKWIFVIIILMIIYNVLSENEE